MTGSTEVVRTPRGPAASPELIDAVRRCAAAKMSYAATADELTTRLRPLSRSAVAGIAQRNKISFSAKKKPTNKPREPRDKRTIPVRLRTIPVRLPKIEPNLVTFNVSAKVRPPGPRCSWVACTCLAELGSMFCTPHGRKGLMA